MGTSASSAALNVGGNFTLNNARITTTTPSGTTSTEISNVDFTIGESSRNFTVNFASQVFPMATAGGIVAVSTSHPGINLTVVISILLHSVGGKANLIQDSLLLEYLQVPNTSAVDSSGNRLVLQPGASAVGTFTFSGTSLNATSPITLNYNSTLGTMLPLGGIITGDISVVPFTVKPVGDTQSYTVSTLKVEGRATYSTEQLIRMSPKEGNMYYARFQVRGYMGSTQGAINTELRTVLEMNVRNSPVSQGLEKVEMFTPTIKSVQVTNPIVYTTSLDTQYVPVNQNITVTGHTLALAPKLPFVLQ